MPPQYPYQYGYPQYNPYQQMQFQSPVAQQLAQRDQMQQAQPPQYSNVQQQTSVPIVVVVTSIEEARAYPPDLNGGTIYFFNKSKGQFYTKTFDIPTGNAFFDTYDKVKPEEEKKPEPKQEESVESKKDEAESKETASNEPVEADKSKEGYLTKDDLNPVTERIEGFSATIGGVTDILESITDKISGFDEMISKMKEEITKEVKELFGNERHGVDQHDGPAEPSSSTDGTDGAGDGPAGDEPRRNSKQSVRGSTKQPPASTSKK